MQVKDLTVEELKTLIRDTVAEAIAEHLDDPMYDPDAGLELQESVKQRIQSYYERRAAGIRGIPGEEVMREFGIDRK